MKKSMMWRILYPLLVAIFASSAGGNNFCSWYTETETLECQRNQFRCLNGEKCIPREEYCNNEIDCGDESDEQYCSASCYGCDIFCSQNFQSCEDSYESNKRCIPKEWKCDGYNDCSNGEDERNCRSRDVTVTRNSQRHPPQGILTANRVKSWIEAQKNEGNSAEKWGPNVDRLGLILNFTADGFSDYETIRKDMAYELNIQLLSQLSSKKLDEIPSTELASYLNAFLVMCVNPRDFHGHNIIQELRNRVERENYTNPYVFLALCNAGETITESDKNKLINTFESRHQTFWTGMQAVVVMALACASKQPGNEMDSETLTEMTLELKQQQFRNGTVVNLPTTALVMQALIAAGSERDPDNFDETKAFAELIRNQKSDGSFGDLMNTFFVTPVLTCKSLMDINSSHCQYGSGDESSALEKLARRKGPKIRVQFSLWIGNEKDLERNLILRVPQNVSLYRFMEIAAEVDSRFKFEYTVKERKPYVNAISGMGDNPLSGKFWFLYVIQDGEPKLSDKSPVDIVPKDNEHYVMWYRRGTWTGGSV